MTKFEFYLHSFAGRTFKKKFYSNFVSNLELEGSEKVLEFGSGSGCLTGFILKKLNQKGVLSCLDISEVAMAILKKKFKEYENINYLLGDINSLHLTENCFDLVIIHFVLHDIPKDKRKDIVCNLSKILKSGGKLIIREPINKKHGIPTSEIRELMTSCSLKEVNMKTENKKNKKEIFLGTFEK